VKKGGFRNTDTNQYGDGDLVCTAAFVKEKPTTFHLPLDICKVNLLVVGGGGGGAS